MRSPKSVLKLSTPISNKAFNLSENHSHAFGLLKSTIPIPACHRSHCHTSPLAFFNKYPLLTASSKRFDFLAIYGLIQTDIFSPLFLSLFSIPSGSGKFLLSH